jgi:AraC-like DNA-binding protein
MTKSLQLLTGSLLARFLQIRSYKLDYNWAGTNLKLIHTVLWFVDSGSITIEVNGVRYRGDTGDLFVLPAGSVITFRAITASLCVISVNMDASISIMPGRLWTEVLRIPVKIHGLGEQLKTDLAKMLQAAKEPGIGQHLIQQAELLRLLYSVLNRPETRVGSEPDMFRGAGDSRIHTVIGYLTANPSLMPDVRELASLVQLSESHLRKLFVESTGLPPNRFVHQLKLEQAKEQLVSTDNRVSDIAFRLGFGDANYFARLFRDKVGVTPQQYRRKYRLFHL